MLPLTLGPLNSPAVGGLINVVRLMTSLVQMLALLKVGVLPLDNTVTNTFISVEQAPFDRSIVYKVVTSGVTIELISFPALAGDPL